MRNLRSEMDWLDVMRATGLFIVDGKERRKEIMQLGAHVVP